MIDTSELRKMVRSAKRWRAIGIAFMCLGVYVAADAIYDPSALMIENLWWQALAVSINIFAAVLNWNNVLKTQDWIEHANRTIHQCEELNRVFG